MNESQQLPHRTWWIAGGVLIAIGIAAGSLAPAGSAPSIGLWDKAEHALGYAALAAWFAGIVPPSRYVRLGVALLAFGVAIELAQGAMNVGRTADPRDVLANGVGIVIGLGMAALGASGWIRAIERRIGGRSSPRE